MATTPSTSLSLSLDSALQPLVRSSHHHHHHRSFSPLRKPHPTRLKFSPPRATLSFFDSPNLSALQKTLDDFRHAHEFEHGSLDIRPMADADVDPTVQLLSESFAESMGMPTQYNNLLAFLVNQYVTQRRLLVPHAAVLVGFYKGRDGGDPQLACTAEISFNARGAIGAPPTPTAPKDCPYICNISVRKALRRKGIGWQLLKACEELISRMNTSARRVYLHCRVIDTAPLNMYKKAGYEIERKDSILIWMTLQRRKYLMFKELPPPKDADSGSKDPQICNNHGNYSRL